MSSQRQAPKGAGAVLTSDSFSFGEAVGGWRGLVESIAPGTVFVTAFVVWGGFKTPTIAALATVAVLVAVRLAQRTPVTQALGGAVGVALGAVWAWRSGDPNEYFVPGFYLSGAYGAGLIVSMIVRWPLAGVVVALVRGSGRGWRADARSMRSAQWATGAVAAVFVARLVVQIPLYLAGATAALGTVKLVMGVPLTALGLWCAWLLVRNLGRPAEPTDPPQQTE